MMSSACSNDTFSSSYPRTGKRGVPQQFPRRLSEMLESEARLASIDPGHQNIINWSASGKAFRIENVSLFSSRILPKYFRTSKFSSFQRNLNLYGFCKVRRGPDTDMYAHPAFVRGHPETLSQLRKCKSSSSSKNVGTSKSGEPTTTSSGQTTHSHPIITLNLARAVSPMFSTMTQKGFRHIEPKPTDRVHIVKPSPIKHSPWRHLPVEIAPTPTPVSPVNYGSGRLDLLTLALTSLAEYDGSMVGMKATAIETA